MAYIICELSAVARAQRLLRNAHLTELLREGIVLLAQPKCVDDERHLIELRVYACLEAISKQRQRLERGCAGVRGSSGAMHASPLAMSSNTCVTTATCVIDNRTPAMPEDHNVRGSW